jgi:DNA-binding response OmpR family regulator
MKAALPKHTLLVVSKDPELADVRKKVLEDAGFEVIPAPDLKALQEACEKHKISLVMIGYSLPPSEKRRVGTWLVTFARLQFSNCMRRASRT